MKNHSFKTFCLSKVSCMFFLVTPLIGLTVESSAQDLYQTAMVANFDISRNLITEPIVKNAKEIKCEGSYSIKDGLLDEIYKLKFVLPSVQLKANSNNNIIGDKKITFEQSHVMVLPVMGMVHVVGSLTIGDVTNTGSFLLKFKVNNDQSISFTGDKSIKLFQYFPTSGLKVDDDIQLDISFVLKNGKTSLGTTTAE